MTAQQQNILSRAIGIAARYRDLLAEARMLSESITAVGGAAAFAAATYPGLGELDHLTDPTQVLLAFAAFNALDAVSLSPLTDAEGNPIAVSALQPILRIIR